LILYEKRKCANITPALALAPKEEGAQGIANFLKILHALSVLHSVKTLKIITQNPKDRFSIPKELKPDPYFKAWAGSQPV
jgi:hypothetical protein